MAKKFDTNPLDPSFPEKVRETQTTALPTSNRGTQRFADPTETEEQTRKLDEASFGSFGNTFDQTGDSSENYQPSKFYTDTSNKNKTHKIGSVSLPENVLMALPYIPISIIGIAAALIELFFIPKSEPKIRYHAAQGLAAHIGILIVTSILGFASIGSDLADTASDIFWLVTAIMLIIFAFKAWKGKPIHIETVESLTDWLEEKIKPQK